VLWILIALITLSITRAVIETLKAGTKPWARFKSPNNVVNKALVDHTGAIHAVGLQRPPELS